MKIAYGMPAVANVTLAGGTWLTADAGSALFDGKPARKSRINRTGSLSLTITLASAIAPRVIALLGLSLPAGVSITAATATATTRPMPDGTVCAWLFPLAGATNTVTVSIATTQATVEIGEIAIFQAIDVGIRDSWQVDYVDATRKERTKAGQLNTIPGAKWRRFTGELSPRSVELAIKGGIAGADWETVANALSGSGKGAIIPMHRDIHTKLFDPELAARSAIYGHAIELPGYTNVQRQYFSSYMAFEEIPG